MIRILLVALVTWSFGTAQQLTSSDSGFVEAWAMAIEVSDHISYVTGFTVPNSLDIDSTYAATNFADMWVGKYSLNSGELQFFDRVEGPGEDVGCGIAVDGAKNIYVAGDSNSPIVDRQMNHGATDMILMKYTCEGEKLFTVLYGDRETDSLEAIAVAPSNRDVYLCGSIGILVENQRSSRDESDMILLKVDAVTGNVVWQQQLGGADPDVCHSVAVDRDSSSVYIAGEISFDSVLAKYDNNGKLVWSKIFPRSGSDDAANDVIVHPLTGNVCFTESTRPIDRASDPAVKAAVGRSYLSCYTPEGLKVFTVLDPKEGYESNSLVADSVGNLYITGYYPNPHTPRLWLSKFNSQGVWLYSGISSADSQVSGFITAIALDDNHIPFTVGTTRLSIMGGQPSSSSHPVITMVSWADYPGLNGSRDDSLRMLVGRVSGNEGNIFIWLPAVILLAAVAFLFYCWSRLLSSVEEKSVSVLDSSADSLFTTGAADRKSEEGITVEA